MNAEVAFNLSYLLGPSGGLIGIAFAAGSAAGWHFSQRTSLKAVNRQLEQLDDDFRQAHRDHVEAMTAEAAECERRVEEIRRDGQRKQEECDRRISQLETRVQEAVDRHTAALERHTAGLERQLAQARESAEQMTGRIDKGRLRPMDEG